MAGPVDNAPPSLVPPAIAAELFDRSRGARWGLSPDAFRAALDASVTRAFAGRTPSSSEVERYLRSLHLEDLALAAACAAALDPAWEHFIDAYRPMLDRAADAIDPTGRARDVADALHADLFGVAIRAGVRQSLFRYFHGRSRLATWLTAVLSQRYVDGLRASRRFDRLEDEEPVTSSGVPSGEPEPERPRFAAAVERSLGAAVAGLDPRDRLRLSCYYVQGLTLAAIGRLLGEHEATASRHLARTRQALDDDVRARLASEHGLHPTAIAECIRSVIDDTGTLDVAMILGPDTTLGADGPAARKIDARDRSKR